MLCLWLYYVMFMYNAVVNKIQLAILTNLDSSSGWVDQLKKHRNIIFAQLCD